MCCDKHRKHDKREPGLFREEFRCSEMLGICSKIYCYDKTSNELKFSSERLNRRKSDQCGDSPRENYRKILDDAVNNTSTNRNFRTKDHTVATHEQIKQKFSSRKDCRG